MVSIVQYTITCGEFDGNAFFEVRFMAEPDWEYVEEVLSECPRNLDCESFYTYLEEEGVDDIVNVYPTPTP